MTGCSAKGCRNSTVKGFVMKRFPRDPARRSAWASNVKREGWEPTNASCLCEVHFDDSQWEDFDWGGTPKLKRTAVPTLFCNCDYGKKRSKTSVSSKSANDNVMTEHSYGTVQGNENNQPTPHNPKGKFDRRGDHQYAILGDESQTKTKVEVKKSHDVSCPMYYSCKRRRSSSMDKNNNGELNTSDTAKEQSAPESVLDTAIVNIKHESANDQLHREFTLLEVDTSGKVQPDGDTVATENSRLVRVVLIPQQSIEQKNGNDKQYLIQDYMQCSSFPQSIVPSSSNEQPVPLGATSNSPVKTKDYCGSVLNTLNTPENNCNQFGFLTRKDKECNCKVDIFKIKAAEKVLARQGRLVKRVTHLQRQLNRQKKNHELEIEKLMKRFHELEEKFDLTRSILRTCVGDDQFTVRVNQNSKGVVWSKKTMEKAMQLRSSCGSVGYNSISKLLIPLPSDRTLQRFNQRSKAQDCTFVEISKEDFNG